MTFPEFYHILESHEVHLSTDQKIQLESFFLHLTKANEEINLISRKESDVISRHFLNCALIACLRKFKPGTQILDIGTGGGFPGLVMAILYPSASFTLAESVQKKATFVETTAQAIGLKNARVHAGRVEKLHMQFNILTCRAVGKIHEIQSWTRHLLKRDGEWILWKGRRYHDEISPAKQSHVDIHHLERFHPSQDGVILSVPR